MWLIFTSRINLSFSTRVQRFTCLRGITKCVCDFESSGGKGTECFWTKMPVVFLWRAGGLVWTVSGEPSDTFTPRWCQMGFHGQRCAAFRFLGTPDLVAWSAFGQFFACTAWDVALQSSCKITIIHIGLFVVSQKAPALLKLSVQSPSSAEEWWRAHQYSSCGDCLGARADGLWMSPTASAFFSAKIFQA